MDARALAGARGVTRYLRELLAALARVHPDDEWHLFAPGRGAVWLELPPNVVVHRHVLPGRVLFGAAAVCGRPRLDRLLGVTPDVVWAPTIAPLALSPGVPLVLTIQDLSFELRPGDFTPYERVWHRLARPRALARRAARVIVLAAPTREQLVDALGPGRRPDRGGGARGLRDAPRSRRPAAARRPRRRRARRRRAPTSWRSAPSSPARPRTSSSAPFPPRARAGLRAGLVFAGEGRLAGSLAGDGVTVLGRVSDARARRALPRRAWPWSCRRCSRATGCRWRGAGPRDARGASRTCRCSAPSSTPRCSAWRPATRPRSRRRCCVWSARTVCARGSPPRRRAPSRG